MSDTTIPNLIQNFEKEVAEKTNNVFDRIGYIISQVSEEQDEFDSKFKREFENFEARLTSISKENELLFKASGISVPVAKSQNEDHS